MELKAKAAAPVSGGTGGAERAFSGATGRTQEENIRWKDSKGGTLVYTHTSQEAKMEIPDNASYVKVEIKGILQTQIMAIGGETTGVLIKAGDLSWELDLGANQQLHEQAERLHGKTVLVKGTLKRISGIERGDRDVVVVESLNKADQ